MNGLMKKAGLGIALAATALTAAAPADAQRYGRGYRHHGGNAAGAAVLGGILGLGVGAAIASSSRDRYYDRGYNGYSGYPRGYYDSYPRGYVDQYRDYQPRCWVERRYDPYYDRSVRVRVCE